MFRIPFLLIVFILSACSAAPVVDKVLVEKSKNKMHLLDGNKTIRTYNIS
jgi:hypothetical protein